MKKTARNQHRLDSLAWAGFGPAGPAAGAFAGRGEVIDPDQASE